MPQISKRPLNKDLENRMNEILWDCLAKTSTKREISLILQDMLTFTERIMVAKRLAIALLLSRGWDQDAISRYLKVSITTIQSIKRLLRQESPGYLKMIERIEKSEGWDKFKLDLGQTLEEILADRLTYGRTRRSLNSEIQKKYSTKRSKHNLL